MNVSKYRNGDIIPQVTGGTQWSSLTTGAWCYYANTTSNGTIYGKLYNWYAINDPRGLAPIGYHIPTDSEWTTLTTCLGGINVAGGAMKEIGTLHWDTPNTGASNSSDFTGLPGGYNPTDGSYWNIGKYGAWWSSSEIDATTAGNRSLIYNIAGIGSLNGFKKSGFSVRCVKD